MLQVYNKLELHILPSLSYSMKDTVSCTSLYTTVRIMIIIMNMFGFIFTPNLRELSF